MNEFEYGFEAVMIPFSEVLDYFEQTDLIECLVIQTQVDRINAQFTIDIDFVDQKIPRGIREFRRYIFSNISAFERLDVHEKHRYLDGDRYQSRAFPMAVSIQETRIAATDALFEIHLFCGSPFGSIRFEFTDVSYVSSKGRAEAFGDTWRYFDTESGLEFDFFDPFGG